MCVYVYIYICVCMCVCVKQYYHKRNEIKSITCQHETYVLKLQIETIAILISYSIVM